MQHPVYRACAEEYLGKFKWHMCSACKYMVPMISGMYFFCTKGQCECQGKLCCSLCGTDRVRIDYHSEGALMCPLGKKAAREEHEEIMEYCRKMREMYEPKKEAKTPEVYFPFQLRE